MGFAEVFDVAMKVIALDLEHKLGEHGGGHVPGAGVQRGVRMAMLRDSAQLQAVIADQQREIDELNFALGTLIHLARDSGAVDLDGYRAAMDRWLAARAEARSAATRDLVRCGNCGRDVRRNQTMITARGILCDLCHSQSY